MSIEPLFSGIAIGLTFAAFLPYIRGILSDTTRPHVFSWIIWGTTTYIVFLAQLQAKGGVGAWPIGVSAGITTLVAILAYMKRADVSVTGTDWAFFAAAMASLPLWQLASDPLWAVVVLTTVDLLGFGPTLRKAYRSPHSEALGFYALFAARNGLVILALEQRSLTTVLFPAAIGAACLLLLALVGYRRRVIAR